MYDNVIYNNTGVLTMKKAVLSVKLNQNDKDEFQKFCASVGLNPSVAINMFVSNVIQNQQLPFAVKSPNKETLEALDEGEYILKHLDEYKSYSTVEELFEDLGL